MKKGIAFHSMAERILKSLEPGAPLRTLDASFRAPTAESHAILDFFRLGRYKNATVEGVEQLIPFFRTDGELAFRGKYDVVLLWKEDPGDKAQKRI